MSHHLRLLVPPPAIILDIDAYGDLKGRFPSDVADRCQMYIGYIPKLAPAEDSAHLVETELSRICDMLLFRAQWCDEANE